MGQGTGGKDVWLGDIWPSSDEIHALMKYAMNAKAFRANYAKVKSDPGELWKNIQGVSGDTYNWPESTYIAEPPFFEGFELPHPVAEAGGTAGAAAPHAIRNARIMALFGDSITTDHISPAGSIKESSPAGRWLVEHGVAKPDFNSYGSRRGNHEVMMRGTFANVRIKNLMIPAGRGRLARGRRRHAVPRCRRPRGEDVYLRRGDEVHGRGPGHGGLRRRGIRHRLLARLGVHKGTCRAAAGDQGGGGAQLRSASIAATWWAWACCRCSSRAT